MNWWIQRTAQAIFTVFVVITISFLMIRTMPGGPANALYAELEEQGVHPQQIRAQVERLIGVDPDAPIHEAYVDYMLNLARGDLGHSIWFSEPVADVLAEALPWTVFILSWAIMISFVLGIVLGALMAYYEGGKLDLGLTTYGMVMGSIPYYVFAILLVLFFAYRIQWFPQGGRTYQGTTAGFNWPYIQGVLHHATLPILSFVLSGSVASLSMRGNSIHILGKDYVRVARLRGLPDSTIAVQYVARNAILPMYTGLMITIGSMFGGAIILEMVFNYRGMGWAMVEAVNARDYPLMMGTFIVITVGVVITLFIADLTYGKIDPRAGSAANRESY